MSFSYAADLEHSESSGILNAPAETIIESEDDVFVSRPFLLGWDDPTISRHSQVQEDDALIFEFDEEVFRSPANGDDGFPEDTRVLLQA